MKKTEMLAYQGKAPRHSRATARRRDRDGRGRAAEVGHGRQRQHAMPIHMAELGSDNFEQEFTLGLMEAEEDTLGLHRSGSGTHRRRQLRPLRPVRRIDSQGTPERDSVHAGVHQVCRAAGEPLESPRPVLPPDSQYSSAPTLSSHGRDGHASTGRCDGPQSPTAVTSVSCRRSWAARPIWSPSSWLFSSGRNCAPARCTWLWDRTRRHSTQPEWGALIRNWAGKGVAVCRVECRRGIANSSVAVSISARCAILAHVRAGLRDGRRAGQLYDRLGLHGEIWPAGDPQANRARGSRYGFCGKRTNDGAGRTSTSPIRCLVSGGADVRSRAVASAWIKPMGRQEKAPRQHFGQGEALSYHPRLWPPRVRLFALCCIRV